MTAQNTSHVELLPVVDDTHREAVSFISNGHKLAGHIYRPPAASETTLPALAMAGPMTSVKEETLPHYARDLAKAGFLVLTFDNRNFGESEGEPRQHLDTAEQVEDLKNAVSYLASRADVDSDRIGLASVCLGAGYAMEVAAFDRRVKTIALIAGGYNISDTYHNMLGDEGFASYLDQLNTARQTQFESNEPQYMDAIAGPPKYAPAAMPVQEAYEYYSTAKDREAPNWRNRLTTASMEGIIGWNVVGHAKLVTQPVIVVHGTTDALLEPKYAAQVYDEFASKDKDIVWIETDNHVQLYDQKPYVPHAISAIVPFLQKHLGV